MDLRARAVWDLRAGGGASPPKLVASPTELDTLGPRFAIGCHTRSWRADLPRTARHTR